VDDLHLGLSSLTATNKVITQFIEKEMGQNDEAAIASASGQVGFLQQLTDNKTVLRAALQRLKVRPYSVRDMERPPMTEYQALLIDRYDRDVTDYFIDEYIRMYPGTRRETVENQIRSRAQAILQQASYVTANTLFGLEGLIRSSSNLPGRKLVFFISDGFFLDNRNSDSTEKLQRITSAAARSGVVIYSMDARGLVASLTDASTDAAFDPSGRLDRATHGELLASQDALNALAKDTGGRPTFNTNALEPGLSRALKETSVYYLLAWKPEREAQGRFHRIEVSVVGRPELTARMRRGFFDVEPEPVARKAKGTNGPKPAETTPEAKLREAISAPYPNRGIPISLNLSYLNTPEKGGLLSTSMQFAGEFLSFSADAGKSKAVVDVAGSVYNDHGQAGFSFKDQLIISAPLTDATRSFGRNFSYTFPVFLGPGLYQVRLAARDEKSGQTGSAHGWIEIPDLSSGRLAMSSLILGEGAMLTATNVSTNNQSPSDQVGLSVDHRFHRNSYLRFLVFVYGAARAPSDSKPDVALQIQVVRDDQPVVTTALKKVETEGVPDLQRLPYAAEVPLEGLPGGRYFLQVTAVDRVSKRSASQQARFEIE
jgi:VWFA-related protein